MTAHEDCYLALAAGRARSGFRRSSRRWTSHPGLLAAGGDLSPQRLLAAYQRGIFPWYSPGQPVLWWSPDPRARVIPRGIQLHAQPRKKPSAMAAFELVVDRDFRRHH